MTLRPPGPIRPVGLPILLPALGAVVAGGLLVTMVVGLAFAGVLEFLPVLGLLLPVGLALGLVGMLLPFCYDWLRSRTSGDDRALFADALADMLEMGLPLDESVSRLAAEMRGSLASSLARTSVAVERIAEGLRQGMALSSCVAATQAFPSRWARLLEAGERLEDLPGSLRVLGRMEGRGSWVPMEALLRIVLVVPIVLGVAGFLAVYILPTFTALFEGMGLELPLATKVFVGTTKVLRSGGLAWGFMLLLGGAALTLLVPSLRDGALALASLLGGGRWRQQALFARAVAASVRLGLSLPEALEIARAGADPTYRKAADRFLEEPSSRLDQVLDSRPDLFEAGLRWMASQGQRYGNLPEALEACATWLEEEESRVRHRRRVLLEFAMLLVAGLFTLTMCIAVMQPLTEMTLRGLMP